MNEIARSTLARSYADHRAGRLGTLKIISPGTRKALELKPDDLAAIGLLVNALRSAGLEAETSSAYLSALDRVPNHAESRANLGLL